MRSSTVSAMQVYHCDCVFFLISRNWVQEISSVVSKLHQCVYFILKLSLSKRPRWSYQQPKLPRVSGIKTCQIVQKTGKLLKYYGRLRSTF